MKMNNDLNIFRDNIEFAIILNKMININFQR